MPGKINFAGIHFIRKFRTTDGHNEVKYGYLNKYFSGIGAKRLSEVEVSATASNQHELNGIGEFRKIFGTERVTFSTRFMYLADDDGSIIEADGAVTWYDARANHPDRTEYRLYYSANDALSTASTGDLVVICKRPSDDLFIIVAPAGSTSEQQLLWLFGLKEPGNRFTIRDLSETNQEVNFAGKHIIGMLGIEVPDVAPDYLEELVRRFGKGFPETKSFSDFARSTVKNVSAEEDPDQTLIAWLEKEEVLFKTLERYVVQQKLKEGFGDDGTDVDDFVSFSLSVQNRRKSRAGHAFENHLLKLFQMHQLRYSRGARTERNNKPDFLFPGIREYRSASFASDRLLMLGVKTSVKDRWRQVLSEADRIGTKHLITLQPAISKNQTDEMKAQQVQLVVPSPILVTFGPNQQKDLITVKDFIALVKEKQTIQWQMSMNLK